VIRFIVVGMVMAACAPVPGVHTAMPAATRHPVLIIGRPVAVTIISYLPPAGLVASNTTPTGRVSVTDRATVASLAHLVNQLNPVSRGVAVMCPIDHNAHARLVFSYTNGDRWTIEAHLDGCERASAHGVQGWIVGPQTDHPRRFFEEIDRLVGFKYG
jgi:hypothetical protein